MWNVDRLNLLGNRQTGGREKQRAMNWRRERSSIGWEWKWRGLKMAISEINTWVFLETESIEQINCQSRFGWRRIIQLTWCSSNLSNNTMLCHIYYWSWHNSKDNDTTTVSPRPQQNPINPLKPYPFSYNAEETTEKLFTSILTLRDTSTYNLSFFPKTINSLDVLKV